MAETQCSPLVDSYVDVIGDCPDEEDKYTAEAKQNILDLRIYHFCIQKEGFAGNYSTAFFLEGYWS